MQRKVLSVDERCLSGGLQSKYREASGTLGYRRCGERRQHPQPAVWRLYEL